MKKGAVIMYENIGGKIKGLAIAFCIIGAIASVISGIGILSDGYEPLLGLLLLLFGPLVAWILSWFIYGYGLLIEKVCDTEKDLHDGGKKDILPVAVKTGAEGEAEKLRARGLITEEEYQHVLSGKQKETE